MASPPPVPKTPAALPPAYKAIAHGTPEEEEGAAPPKTCATPETPEPAAAAAPASAATAAASNLLPESFVDRLASLCSAVDGWRAASAEHGRCRRGRPPPPWTAAATATAATAAAGPAPLSGGGEDGGGGGGGGDGLDGGGGDGLCGGAGPGLPADDDAARDGELAPTPPDAAPGTRPRPRRDEN